MLTRGTFTLNEASDSEIPTYTCPFQDPGECVHMITYFCKICKSKIFKHSLLRSPQFLSRLASPSSQFYYCQLALELLWYISYLLLCKKNPKKQTSSQIKKKIVYQFKNLWVSNFGWVLLVFPGLTHVTAVRWWDCWGV